MAHKSQKRWAPHSSAGSEPERTPKSAHSLLDEAAVRFLRYPGGKQRILDFLLRHLPTREAIQGRFVEPFVGGGAIFFALDPRAALLTDANAELIDLYRGLRRYPGEVWDHFRGFPSSKRGYYDVRGLDPDDLDLAGKAARTLYLNRTCFKGMWRHNSRGQFNVGYGGQDRRWALGEECLQVIARRLRRAVLRCCDFEESIEECTRKDFLFLDPPYQPGERDLTHDHFAWSRFRYADHERLARALHRAAKRSVCWAMTTTSHPDVLGLFPGHRVTPLPRGPRTKRGRPVGESGEVLIHNYEESREAVL
jgi:DNA adenine methylase